MPPLHHHFIDKLAVVNGVATGFALFPQIYDILVRGMPNGFSPLVLVLILGNNIVWTLYAIHRTLISLTVAAILNVIAASILLLI